jgi:hypothetical protein
LVERNTVGEKFTVSPVLVEAAAAASASRNVQAVVLPVVQFAATPLASSAVVVTLKVVCGSEHWIVKFDVCQSRPKLASAFGIVKLNGPGLLVVNIWSG